MFVTNPVSVSSAPNCPDTITLDPFFTLSPDGLCVIGLDGTFHLWNPTFEALMGWSVAELAPRSWLDLMHPEDRPAGRAGWQALIAGDRSQGLESRFLCQNQSYRWFFWQGVVLPEQQLVYLTLRDITDKKRADETQRRNEERFRLLVEGVKDYAIYLLDPQGVIVSWNLGAERIKGYRAEEVIGRHYSCFFLPTDIEQGKPQLALQAAIQLGRFESEGYRVRQDGSQFWVNAVVTALRDERGQLRGFAKVTRDITERKEAEAALKRAFDQLEHRVQERTQALSATNALLRQEITEREQIELALRDSEAQLKQQTQKLQTALMELKQTQAQLVQSAKMSSLGQLVAGIAHEINNPINFIYGNLRFSREYTQTLLELIQRYQDAFPQPGPELAALIEAVDLEFVKGDLTRILDSMAVGADRIRTIVLSLRNFARLDEADMKAVDLHEGLENSLLILQSRLAANGNRPAIAIQKAYGTLPDVECYAGQLNQVLIHVLNNAIDALETLSAEQASTPIITIETQCQDGQAMIYIRDNGPGMTETVRQHIFDPFFTTKPVGQGTGLSLAISYQIVVNQHRGQIDCTSAPGEGTVVAIAIPLSQAAAPQ